MSLFDLFKKKSKKNGKKLDIYSGMQVVVKALDGKILFFAKLQELQENAAVLYEYSETDKFQNIAIAPIPVKLRGYSDWERKVIFMNGNMFPLQKHTWQVDNLTITKIENERAFPRFTTDIAATVTTANGIKKVDKPCKILNISLGGACIESEHRYNKGDTILLKARLLEDRPLSVMYCEVLRVVEKDVSRFEYGCHFVKQTEANQEELAQTITLIAGK